MVTINGNRLLNLIAEQGKIGWIDGYGLNRLAFSDNFFSARNYMQNVMDKIGLQTRVDSVGNLFGVYQGKTKQAKKILSGSHLDAVAGGGIYDGAYGICAALEVARTLKENNIVLDHAFEVGAFHAEEGGPWGGTFGSRAFTGLMETPPTDDILQKLGIKKQDIVDAKADLSQYTAFLEAHIEQGPVLWQKGLPLGIPTGIFSINRYECKVIGQANHAGTTPLSERKDALYDAAKAITEWMDCLRKQEGIVGNVGILEMGTKDATIVPSEVTFLAEIRSLQEDKVQEALLKLESLLQQGPCQTSVTMKVKKPAVALNQKIVGLIGEIAAANQITAMQMPSGASHDSSPMARVMPTGMLFVPSIRGISHNKEEKTDDDSLILGTQMLLDTVLRLDKMAL